LADMLRNSVSEKTLSDYDLRQWRVRASTWSLRQLRQYKRELDFKAEHKTAQQAKDYLRNVRKAEHDRPYPGFPTLPRRGIPKRGPIQTIEFDAEYLKSLDAWELKRFVRVYGEQQINDRLAGR